MKKLSTLLIIAFALVLGLTQCKKKVDTIATPSDLGKTVYITVNVGDGDRHIVYPGTGEVVYTYGDKIYVGDGKKYLGTLTYGSSAFSGNITEPAEGDYLYFYFLGGIEISPVAATTSYEISIANQSSKLPVLSFGRSTSTYTTSSATYGCTLLNKCGLVKFVPATPTTKTVRVHGMKTTATIDFATPGITPTNATGTITLYPESDEAKWAILLPQDEVSNTDGIIGNNYCTISKVPEVTANLYSISGVSMTVKPGMLGGLFTINPGGNKVRFSQGNLQYQATTNTWQFAEHQYDYVGDAAGNTAPSASQSGWIDLFGWGTSGISGYTPIATCYQPWSTSTNGILYNPYGSTSTNLYDGGANAGKADWGYNAISNGGNTGNMWRTLTNAEWGYVFNTRSTTSGHRYAKATVCGKSGVILLPDNWSDGTYSLNNYNTTGAAFTGNTIDADEWATLEAAGCVFLPAAGYRNGTSVGYVGSNGGYWSSTSHESEADLAYRVRFSSDDLAPQRYYRYFGYSVRLARVVE